MLYLLSHLLKTLKLLVIFGFLSLSISSYADIVLDENFTSGNLPVGWTNIIIQGAQGWSFANSPVFGSPSGGYYTVFDDQALGAAVTPNEAAMESPVLDFSNRTSVALRYSHHWFGVEFTHGYVEISNDGGTTWTTVSSYELVTQGSLATPITETIDVTTYAANQATVQVRFRYSDGGQAGKFWFLDDVRMYSDPDVGVSNLVLADYLGCSETYSNAETITVEITNYGVDSITNIPVACVITGGVSATITGTYNGPVILEGQTANFTFATTVDMSVDDVYHFLSYTNLGTDAHLMNDTLLTGRRQYVQSYPYLEQYDYSDAGWREYGSTPNRKFVHGEVPYLNGPDGNGKSWYIDVTGDLWNSCFVESPVFDFTSLTNPTLSMDAKFNLYGYQSWQYVKVEYTIDDGVNWSQLGTSSDLNWYNQPSYFWYGSQPTWKHYQKTLCNLIGESCVQFRFHAYNGYGGANAYFAFDNFEIIDSIDVGLFSFVQPLDEGCLFSPDQEVIVSVKNWSCGVVDSIPVVVEISGATALTLNGMVPAIPANGSVDYAFSSTFDMTPLGVYDFSGYTDLLIDGNLNNDTTILSIDVTQTTIATFPYTENFDVDDGEWELKNETVNRQWLRGAVPYLAGPSGNGNSWYLDYVGDAWNPVYVESPVFDFSENTKPVLSLDVMYNLNGYQSWQYIRVEYSIDGGNSWVVVGTSSDPNWYNYPTNWYGSQPTWTNVTHDLCAASGYECVKLRVVAYCGYTGVNAQAAFDNIIVDDGSTDDLEPILISEPSGGDCSFFATESIGVEIRNNTCRPLTNVPVVFTMSGANSATLIDTVPGPIPAFGEYYFIFSNTVDLSTAGLNNLAVTINSNLSGVGLSYINDTTVSNNTISEVRYGFAQTVYPILDDFDTDNDGWEAYPFQYVDNHFTNDEVPYLNGPEGNGESWYLSVTGHMWNDAYVESPVYDFSSMTNPILSADIKYYLNGYQSWQYVRVEYSIDGGAGWNTLGSSADPDWYTQPNYYWYGSQPTWEKIQHSLCSLVGESCVKFRFHAYCGYGLANAYFAFDNFEIKDVEDVSVIRYIDPVDVGCLFGQQQQVTVEVYNFSCSPVSNIPMTCDITGQVTQTLSGTMAGPIPAGGSVYYTFPASIDMTPTGVYNFDTYTQLPTDINFYNDHLGISINVNQLKVTNFPYSEDFDTSAGYWLEKNETPNRQWHHGQVPYLAGPAGNGDSWYLDYVGDLWNPVYVESPVFDFSSITNPVLSLDIMYYLNGYYSWQYGRVEYSLDGGINWSVLGTSSDPNWYNYATNWYGNQPTWTNVSHDLCQLSGQECVKLRMASYCGYGGANAYFAFDNVYITEGGNDDLEPILVFQPDGGDCSGFGNNEPLGVLLQNNTCRSIYNLPIDFNLTGANTQSFSEIAPGPIPAFGKYYYSFSNTVDMSATGTYNLEIVSGTNTSGVGIEYINDTTISNNSYTEVRYANPINTFPYSTDFESNNDGWASAPLSDTQRLFLRDSLPYLGGPDGNGKSWYFDVTGQTWNTSWVESPVFDFSSIANPIFKMDVKFYLNGYQSWQYCRVEYSINGGVDWSILGNSSDPDWYNQPNYYWYGSTPDWTKVQRSLCTLVGESCVKFRVAGYVGYGGNNAQFAFDNFEIVETYDVGVIAFVDPVLDHCLYLDNQQLTVQLHNWSCSSVTGIPIVCDITGANNVTLNTIYNGTINADGDVNVTFPTTFDMIDMGDYFFDAYTDYSLDVNLDNDTTSQLINVDHLKIDTFDYFEDFNSSEGFGGWTVTNNTANRNWKYGSVPYLGGEEGRGDSWYIEFLADAWAPVYLESPVYDFTNLSNPKISFEEKHYLNGYQSWQYVRVEYTIDGETTWNILGTSAEPDWYTQPSYFWYGNSPDWKLVQHELCNLAGESCVKFRITAYCGYIGNNAQFAFDNFHISDTPLDASIDIIYGCHGSEYPIEVDVYNVPLPCTATPTINELDLIYSIDGSVPVSVNYTGLNIAGGAVETLELTGITIPSENSTVKVWVNFPNGFDDQFFENDTVTMPALNWPDCNDHCSNATQLSIGTTTASQTSNATIASSEDPTYAGCGAVTIENTVWYSFATTSSTDSVTVVIENQVCSPTNQGLQVAILEASIPCDASTYSELFCAAPNNLNVIQYGPVLLSPNTTYYIGIDGVAGNDCDFDITLSGNIALIPEVQFSAPLSGVVDEDGGTYTMQLEIIDPSLDYPTKVDVILQSGNGSRITSWSTQTVTFPAGSNTNQTLTLSIEDNLLCDGHEDLVFILGNAYVDNGGGNLAATIGTQDIHDIEVKDDETFETPAFSEDFETGAPSFAQWKSDDPDWLLNSSGGMSGTYDMVFAATSSSGSLASSHNKNLLSYDCMKGVNTTWQMNISYTVEPTPTNQAILGLSEFGYPSKESGYRLVIGENTGTDVISVIRVDEGVENSTPVFQADFDWMISWTKVGIEVIRDDIGNWRVSIDTDGDFDNLVAIADNGVGTMNGMDDTYNFLGNIYFGVDYGSTPYGRLSVDDIEVGIQGCGTTYYSQTTGMFDNTIWSQIPSGTASTALYNQYSNFVVQGSDVVTIQNDNCISALGIETGATLIFDSSMDGLELGVSGDFNNQGTLSQGKSDVVMNGHELQIMQGQSGSTLDFHSLQIANDNGGVVTNNDYIVSHLLYPRLGILNLNGHNIKLPSGSAGTGGIYTMNYPASDVTGGDITLERYIQPDILYETTYLGGWVALSSPIIDGGVSNWDETLITTGFPGSGWPNYAYPNGILFNNIIHYNESTGAWVGASDISDVLGTHTGYFMYMQQFQQNTSLTGDFNHGDTPMNLAYTSAMGGAAGWNLVSNPYPCEIDWRLLYDESTDVSPTMYIYDSDYSVYHSYNANTQSGTASPLIASSQSFWVKANTASSILNFTEEVKTYEADSMVFERSESMSGMLVFQLNNGVIINESYLGFNEVATDDFDMNYDSQNMAIPMPQYNVAYVSSMSQDEMNLDYNFYATLTESTIVPIWVDIYFEGEFEFGITGLNEEVTTGCVYLEDVVTGEFTQVEDNFVYPFENDVFSGVRFNLHFSGELQAEIQDVTCTGLMDGSVTVQAPSDGEYIYTWVDENDVQIAEEITSSGSSELTDLSFGNYVITVAGESELCQKQTVVVYVDEPSDASFEIYSTPDYCNVGVDGEIVIDVATTASYNYQIINEDEEIEVSGETTGYLSLFVESGDYEVVIAAYCDTTNTFVSLYDPTEPIVEIEDPVTDYEIIEDATSVEMFMAGEYTNVVYESWIVNNVLVSNEAELLYTITLPGEYEVALLGWNDESNCYGADTTMVTVIGEVTTVEELMTSAISMQRVFDGLEVDLQDVVTEQGRLHIVNSLGQSIQDEPLENNQGKSYHSLKGLSRGIYMVTVLDREQVLYQGKVVWMDH